MTVQSDAFQLLASDAMAQEDARERRDALGIFMPAMRDQAVAELGDFEQLRSHVKKIKDHTLNHLSHYLRQFEEQVVLHGGHVHWARDGDELNRIVLEICEAAEARQVGKGKSMVTEETGLTAALESAGMGVTETDLGEYIVQIAGETPSHIIGPAFHKSEQEIRDLFYDQHALGERDLADPPAMVQEARQVLRERFLAADVGIIGSNALIAETGQTMLVTNEGNGDLVSSLPRVQIVCATIEKVVPRPDDALSQLRLLVSSAIGTAVTAYTSFYSGPRRNDDLDGPEAFHVVLLDNRRSEMLGSRYQDMLACMRCGACLNHCPIYVGAGGHAYGWVYPGPMGSVLTPLLTSLEDASDLPNACTSCGRCEEVCPAEIPLPGLLRELRADEHRQGITPRRWRWGMTLHSFAARTPALYQFVTGVAVTLLHMLGKRRGHFRSLLLANGWTQVRDFPAPEGRTFMRQWKRQQAAQPSPDDDQKSSRQSA